MSSEPTVFVVDDDEAMRTALRRLMESAGLPVEVFSDATAFLRVHEADRPGCLVVDIRMPGMCGLELQQRLREAGTRLPVIVISGHADVESAVVAMKAGAVDFLRKPYDAQVLVERTRAALELNARHRAEAERRALLDAALSRLTPREREVFDRMIVGRTPKQIALELGLSRKTVDIHRAHVLIKMQVDSVVDLVRALHGANAGPASDFQAGGTEPGD